MATIRMEFTRDAAAREALLDRAFGEARFRKTAERLREGRLPAKGLSFVATDNHRVVGTVRLWQVSAGPARPALLLGPLAVDEIWATPGGAASIGFHARHLAGALDRLLLVSDPPITADSASRRRRPGGSGCRDRTSGRGCWRRSSCPAPWTTPTA
jgi:hypothetical protein